jgi:alkylation response protein AidB-like acyl-CoA dehydrogenase
VDLSEGRVSGITSFVLDGMTADRLLVRANSGGAPCVVEVDAASHGVARTPLPGLDQTRKLAHVVLSDAPAEVLLLPDVLAALDALQRRTIAAVAAEQVGCAQAAFNAALDHARSRRQFGRVIGSYQAIKHRFADLALGLEQARAAAYNAAWVLDNRPQDTQGKAEVAAATALARIVCTQTAIEASEWCMQVRGGQGFRWDNVAHLYLKRAKSSQLLFGDPGLERERIADLLDLTPPP